MTATLQPPTAGSTDRLAALRSWFLALRFAPAALTRTQRIIVVVTTAVVAISRWFALSLTPWDWDEMLFMLAMRRYDVFAHHPHPPGFPLFIFAAKIVHRFGLSDFRSLQTLAFIGAVLIFPATFFLCRELRMRFVASVGAGLILAFFPNVWFFGGTAFSDVPSMTLVIIAMALLLGGCRDGRLYIAGATVLGIAAAVRPQNLVIGVAPALIGAICLMTPDCDESRGRAAGRRYSAVAVVVTAALIILAIVGISYAVAAYKTGFDRYHEAVVLHADYIAKIDSFRAPGRPPLWRLVDDFFLRPYRAPFINTVVALLAVISVVVSIVRLRAGMLVLMAAFGPFCLFAWLMLDRFSVSRFSIGYAPLLAVLAADGASIIAAAIASWGAAPRRSVAESVIVAIPVAAMIGWTWPSLEIVHSTLSPPVEACHWIRAHVSRTTLIYVNPGLGPYADEFLSDYKLLYVRAAPAAEWTARHSAVYLSESLTNGAGSANFRRDSGRLWNLVRRRYFEVSVRPVSELVKYGEGWYGEEAAGAVIWRWMASRSVTTLPRMIGPARLTLAMVVPAEALAKSPAITVFVNGAVVARVRPVKMNVTVDCVVPSHGDAPNILVIETDRLVRVPHDVRALGLRLDEIGWQRAD